MQKFAFYAAIGVTVLEGLNLIAFWLNKLAELFERRKHKAQARLTPLSPGRYAKVDDSAIIGA